MKITEVETIPVHVPIKAEVTMKTSHGAHVVSPYVLVRIHTDEGIFGLGEATLSPTWTGETRPGGLAVIRDLFTPLLLGQDPRNVNALMRELNRVLVGNPFAKAAIDMALWDLAGKAAGVPVHQLLGGKVRDELPIKLVIGAVEPDAAVVLARRFLDWGVKTLKVKVGPGDDVARIRAVREFAGPDIPIGIDANEGWDIPTARRLLAELEPFNLYFCEQPIPRHDAEALAELRRSTNIPIKADESVFTPADAIRMVQHHAADIFSVYPGKHGGITPTLEIAAIAKAAGLAVTMGSNLELGPGTAAMLHVGIACDAFRAEQFPGDYVGPWYHESDLLKTPLDLGLPNAKAPDGPGLGVELDDDLVEKYRDTTLKADSIG
ncbi:MAG: mandelate racemase/muconate lactonizing protein [Verrucomicrobiales bacterium]|nr:mandelate racemase/muconate lactonizing protein [Verrucomicrobiales bacterium]|tara:strand:+ start:4521 stop:5654 length:1134 start_codon:yes stop_codon:yes gene_type:complete